MSVWSQEIVRIDGDLMVAARIQDDWTGTIRTTLRQMHMDEKTGRYWYSAEGARIDITTKREDFLRREDQIEAALKWFKETKWNK